MKKFLLLPFLIFSQLTFAQITRNPEISRQSDTNIDILKVELTEKNTIITFYYLEVGNEGGIQIGQNGIQNIRTPYQISIEPTSYLLTPDGQKFKFLRATHIPLSPKDTTIRIGERLKFTAYFERLEKGLESFDFIEGKNSKDAQRHFWNFYGVRVTNPAPKNTSKPQPKVEPKPMVASKISVSGKIINAKTNEPISAKIICLSGDKKERKDSVTTSLSGVYNFELKPNAYLFEVSAKGFEPQNEPLDLSKMAGKNTFSKDILLKPLDEAVPIAKEILLPDSAKTEEKPTAIQENVFRLDKVYFSTGQSNLLPESYPQLNGLLKMLKENSAMTIQVEGHTDNVGEAALNKRLSLDRAFSVREYLVGKGIAGNRIKFKGLGDSQPIASNETEEGRAKNRRVEFVILTK